MKDEKPNIELNELFNLDGMGSTIEDILNYRIEINVASDEPIQTGVGNAPELAREILGMITDYLTFKYKDTLPAPKSANAGDEIAEEWGDELDRLIQRFEKAAVKIRETQCDENHTLLNARFRALCNLENYMRQSHNAPGSGK